MGVNGVSIVIATKGRVKLLGNLLESLVEPRKNYSGPTEVLLIDDSSENEQKEIDVYCDMYDARRIFFGPSVSGKRNYGAEQARYEIVLFLDSDCLATPHIIEQHAELYSSEKIGAVAGPLEFTGHENWFWQSVKNSPYTICFKMPYWDETSVWGTTANFSVRKSAFEEIKGFDTTFPNKPGGEDVDLGLRLTKKGFIIRNTKEGLVYHDKATWSAVKPMFRRCWYYGRADVYVVDRHPDYSCQIPPRKLVLDFIALLFIAISGAVFNPWCFVLMPMWLLADWSVYSLIQMKYGFGKNDFLHEMVIILMMAVNELGYIWECIVQGKISYIGKRTMFFDNQIKSVPDNAMRYIWQFIIQFVVLTGIIAYLK